MNSHRASVPGSYRDPLPEAQIIGPVDADATVEATLVLRRRAELPEPAGATLMSSAELADRFGADPQDVDLVTAAVTDAGARVVEADPASRRVRISGTARSLQSLFGTTLERAHVPDPAGGRREVRHRTGELSLPAELEGVVTAVLGLDDRPQLRARLRIGPAAAAAATSYTPLDLARIYAMPAGTDGTGQTLAILELGGGFAQSDLDTYFSGLGLATPSVTAVGVDGAVNTPGKDPQGADGEVLLDIEVAGAIAPKAAIVVYFAPNTDAGFLDAVSAATHATPTPTAMSISWGQGESGWTAQAATAMDQAFADAVALGITVTAAAGDSGSSDTAGGGTAQVDFPASSPHVLGCGGTSLVADPASGTVTSETVWNDGPGKGATGGGVSVTFPLPTWQADVGVPPAPATATTAPPAPGKTFHPGAGSTPPPASGTTPPAAGTTPPGSAAAQGGRGVPDVAADADPATGYRVFVDGKAAVYGGTSAVAPLWAALVCRLAQSLKRPLGLLQPALYAAASPGVSPAGFRDITSGNNGSYQAGPGWDACTGLGVPDGTALLGALGGTATTTTAGTGTPGTPGAPGATGAPGTPGTR